MLKATPENLIGDKAHDSDPLDAALREQGVEIIAPHRSNRTLKTQDGRRLRRYERRWVVERFAECRWCLPHHRPRHIHLGSGPPLGQGFLGIAPHPARLIIDPIS